MNELDRERREVAECLRFEAVYKEESRSAVGFLSWLFEIITGTDDFFNDSELLNKLADLIDRPTTTVKVRKVGDSDSDLIVSCNSCCRGWHVSEYDKPFSYCPECGAEVVDE